MRPRNFLTSYKSKENFRPSHVLRPEEASGKFSHSVEKNVKIPANQDAIQKSKYQHVWYLKEVESMEKAWAEVLAQEFIRLFHPAQPKTRVVVGKDGKTYVASKEVPGFARLSLGENRQSLKEKLNSGRLQGLGIIHVLALFLNEIDLKDGNLGKDLLNNAIKIDGDRCFRHLMQLNRGKQPSSKVVTAEDLILLPFVKSYGAFNWFDTISQGNRRQSVFFDESCSLSSAYRQEINETLLALTLLPSSIFNMFIRYYVPHPVWASRFEREFQENKLILVKAAFSMHSFCDYIRHIDFPAFAEKLTTKLKSFTATKKKNIFSDIDIIDAMKGKFDKVIEFVNQQNSVPMHQPDIQPITTTTTTSSSVTNNTAMTTTAVMTTTLNAPEKRKIQTQYHPHLLDEYSLKQLYVYIKDPENQYINDIINKLHVSEATFAKQLRELYGTNYTKLKKMDMDVFFKNFGTCYDKKGAEIRSQLKKQKKNDNNYSNIALPIVNKAAQSGMMMFSNQANLARPVEQNKIPDNVPFNNQLGYDR